ncbi:helix-turn-helix transcriptional regulator [Candidatus Collierbacteria bacterium]|nr:helix-turn-helix transcriptional regulator [Candidatus Collierbacteria bacterium]
MPSLKFNPQDSVIVVETKIWGVSLVSTVRLVFDIGASLVILPWKLVTGLGLKIDQTKVIQTTQAVVSRLERMATNVSIEFLKRIAEAFGTRLKVELG